MATPTIPAGGMRPSLDHVPWLDGLRGIAALWVLLSHAQILSGMRPVPVLSFGGVAVDLFMMLSGFLMAHHYLLRRPKEPWRSPRTWTVFWLRRWFRITPLYWPMLLLALALGPFLGEMRGLVADAWPATATNPGRYTDASWDNLLMHAGYLFGFSPDYAFRTALPDWSIGLEMQFYLAFPFLMLLVAASDVRLVAALAVVLGLGIELTFPGFIGRFEMPTLLPMKLHVFFVGVLLAAGRMERALPSCLAVALATLAVHGLREGTLEAATRCAVAIGLFYLMDEGSLPGRAWLDRPVGVARRLLSGGLGRFLGDSSYALYLLHLLVLIPVAGLLAARADYVALPSPVRFALCLAATLPLAYAGAWLLHRAIEQPGIALGKQAVAVLRRRTGSAPARR